MDFNNSSSVIILKPRYFPNRQKVQISSFIRYLSLKNETKIAVSDFLPSLVEQRMVGNEHSVEGLMGFDKFINAHF